MKAISAIIVTVMLLMISVSLIGVFYVFSSTLASSSTSSGSAQVSQLTSQFTMCMRIDNIINNQISLRNCGKGIIENKSLVVTIDDVKLGASTLTINEGDSGTVNITGLWQIAPGKRNLKISNGAAFALALVDVQPNSNGLIGAWDFSEGSGNNAYDDSGNGNTGTLVNNPQWINGKFGKGLQFNGVNDYVNIPNSASLNTTSELTITVLVNPSSYGTAGGWIAILGKNSYTNSYLIWFDSGSGYLRELIFVGGVRYDEVPAYVLPLNSWTHITYTARQGELGMFVNGEKKTPLSIPAGAFNTNTNPLTISGQGTGTFSGIIDEVRIWNRALVPDETVVMKQII